MMRSDLASQRFGRLVVEEFGHYDRPRHATFWICKCDCGVFKIVSSKCLRRRTTSSCGCYRKENFRRIQRPRTIHGHAHRHSKRSRAYNAWMGIRDRCRNPNHTHFKYYGGRGIAVCERWKDFNNFLVDMGQPPENLSLDRIDNSRGYSPDNCRWATAKEQRNNRNKEGYLNK